MVMTSEELQEQYRRQALTVPRETRQKFLDLMHSGKNLGDAKNICGIEDTLVASAIILMNVKSYKYVGTETL
jgi:hypothetical protein